MASNPVQERQQAHELLDMLPDEKLAVVRSLLQVMIEPLSASLAKVPVDDHQISDDTARSLEHARSSLARGEGIPHDEVLREFGLNK